MEQLEEYIRGLKKNRFQVEYFETGKEFVDYAIRNLPTKASIGFGGSMTLEQLHLYDRLSEAGFNIYWHWRNSEIIDMKERALNADIYFSSANAVTKDGKIINMDGTGNRVANTFYHHEEVFIVCGINKLVETVDEGIARIEQIAAPKNAQRLGVNTPCVVTGVCTDCTSKDRICNVLTIIEKNTNSNINVILIGEELGY
ncbi:lactate utilization protein [Gallicola sp. Sow4_E12]|uniref:lactate utilization protein n=1 Tax=Gallicola sp. Sow4_E12 TaxID=3438785 RepID=UPI003F9388BA